MSAAFQQFKAALLHRYPKAVFEEEPPGELYTIGGLGGEAFTGCHYYGGQFEAYCYPSSAAQFEHQLYAGIAIHTSGMNCCSANGTGLISTPGPVLIEWFVNNLLTGE